MSQSKARITQLDGVRAVAMIAVFVHHLFRVKLLWMGVDLFFVLSGFLITGILLDEKEKKFAGYIGGFYRRRVVRILPPYLMILVITTAVDGVGWLRHWYFYAGAMNFLLPLHVPFPLTLPLWSLAVEEQFYLLWPLAVFFLSRKHLIWCSVGILAAAPLLRGLCAPFFVNSTPIYELTPFRMDTLAAGALLALAWPSLRPAMERVAARRAATGIAIVAIGGSLVALLFMGKHGITTDSNTRISNVAVYEATLIISVACMVLALVGFGKRILTFRPLRQLGMISYSVYLFHLLAIRFASGYAFAPLLAAVLAIGYSATMWRVVENPLLKWDKGRAKRHQLAEATAA
jgi:peptidoglycan/LPS O-acetylase OafA/YrhL